MKGQIQLWKEYKKAVDKYNLKMDKKRLPYLAQIANANTNISVVTLSKQMRRKFPIIEPSYEGFMDWLANDKKL